MTYQVDGARKLRASLKAAGVSIADLKAVNAAVAQTVHRAAHPNAPVGETHRLADSERASGTQAAAVVRAGRASVPYAGPIHWGWPARNIVAQPWIQQAAERTETTWLDQYLGAMEAVISHVEGATP